MTEQTPAQKAAETKARKAEEAKAAEAAEAQRVADEAARELEAERLRKDAEAQAAAQVEADAARAAVEASQPQTYADESPLAAFVVVDGDSHGRREVARGARTLATEWLDTLPEGEDRDAALEHLSKAREAAAKAANSV